MLLNRGFVTYRTITTMKTEQVWIVCRVADNLCVGVYTSEERAASWTDGPLEPHYYYELHEVND
jgi:uncharacterized protein (DUF2384 family)